MNSKFYISLEAARLLKEKGYDRECMAYYQNDEFRPYNLTRSGLSMYNKNAAPDYMNQYSAPTKAEAIDWLESKGLIVETKYYSNRGNNRGRWSAHINRKDSWAYVALGEYYLTRLEAEDSAIIKALEWL